MLQTYCELHGIPEISTIHKGDDLRRPELRKEVFIRFYEFMTMYGIHTELIYIYIPALIKEYHWTKEQALWFSFLMGCSENIFMAWYVFNKFPELPIKNLDEFERWHKADWRRLVYDKDCKYNKGFLVEQTKSYINLLQGRTQEEYFNQFYDPDKEKWFDNLWNASLKIYKFGRVMAWTYLEFLKVASGWDFRFSNYFINDQSGSCSIRNGILYLMGREELQVWRKAENGITCHSKELMKDLDRYAEGITQEIENRFKDKPWSNRVGRETIETLLCGIKQYFHGSSYLGYYVDYVHDALIKAASRYPNTDFSLFWRVRKEQLPRKLLVEFNPNDPGFCAEKKVFFRNTGAMPMISVMDNVFDCEWDRMYYGSEVDLFFNPS